VELHLGNGRRVVVRPIRDSDREPLQRGLRRLGPQSRIFRFHHDRTQFSDSELDYLVACDGIDRIAYVARGLNDEGEEIDEVGVARAHRKEDKPTAAEVAVVVVDEWQRQGIGRTLLSSLAIRCREVGIRRWDAHVMGANHVAAQLFESFGTVLGRNWDAGVQTIEIELSD
jgi:GNAT superfamily N-acetyltransferase